MRHYDIPYVKNTSGYSIPLVGDIDSLDLQTIVKYHLCGKSHGKVSECMKCPAPCAYGKRALELAFPSPSTVPAPKLIDNKTLLELAREETAKSRAAEQKAEEPAVKTPEKKTKRAGVDDWYNKAYESENPLQWIMDTFGLTERKAKAKVYEIQYRHPELKEKPLWAPKSAAKKAEAKAETKPASIENPEPAAEKQEPKKEPDSMLAPLEGKINELMNLQEEYKKKYEHYQKLYQETKTKVDALYEALNILNE